MIGKASVWITCLISAAAIVLAPVAACAMDEDEAREAFKAFQIGWLEKLNRVGRYGPGFVSVEKDGKDGLYVARYRKIGKPLASKVKKTKHASCPYVGVFSYEELVYFSRGASEKEASKGPYEYEKTVKITEVFRVANGKWIY